MYIWNWMVLGAGETENSVYRRGKWKKKVSYSGEVAHTERMSASSGSEDCHMFCGMYI